MKKLLLFGSLFILANMHIHAADMPTTEPSSKKIRPLTAPEARRTLVTSAVQEIDTKKLALIWHSTPKEDRIWLFSWASLVNNPDYVRTFLVLTENKKEADTAIEGGLTPLGYAISNVSRRGDATSDTTNACDIIKALIEAGADPKKKSPILKMSPLEMAQDSRIIPNTDLSAAIQALLTHCITTTPTTTDLKQEILKACYAKASARDFISLWEKTASTDRTWLIGWATLKNEPNFLRLFIGLNELFKLSSEVDTPSEDGAYPLHRAVSNMKTRGDGDSDTSRALAIIKLLLQAGAQPDRKSASLGNRTPFELAEILLSDPDQETRSLLEAARILLTPNDSVTSKPATRASSPLVPLPSGKMAERSIYAIRATLRVPRGDHFMRHISAGDVQPTLEPMRTPTPLEITKPIVAPVAKRASAADSRHQ